MSAQLVALVAAVGTSTATERARLAQHLRRRLSAGCVLVTTCHRTEAYGPADDLASFASEAPSIPLLEGDAVARHLVRLAVGRESAVLAEDQVLHQLRQSVQQARHSGRLAPELDRLLDLALQAGRRARSWLPARRTSLADIALQAVIDEHARGRQVLIVGAGEMGRLTAAHAAARGMQVRVASRTHESALLVARAVDGVAVPFDPGPEVIAEAAAVVVALAGRWPLAPRSRDALVQSGARVADVSAPSALTEEVLTRLGDRLVTIDHLADRGGAAASPRLIERLDGLVEQTLNEYRAWRAGAGSRASAAALARRASVVQAGELERLWRRAPDLSPDQRHEIEKTVRQVTSRLLREPLESAAQDGEGRHATALRELFRL